MKVSKNFTLAEFVFPELLETPGIDPMWFIDPQIIFIAQFLRDRYKRPVTINNWVNGGHYSMSGLRPFNTTLGAELSLHKYGQAIDPKVDGIEALEVQEDVIQNQELFMDAGVTAMEHGTPTWTHFDCRNTSRSDILIIEFNTHLKP